MPFLADEPLISVAVPSLLPDKPSALLRLALEDLAKAETTPGSMVYMWNWHTPFEDEDDAKVCSVCLAGAVMAFSLQSDRLQHLSPFSFDVVTRDKLLLLNLLREGDTSSIEGAEDLDRCIPPYFRDPMFWRAKMLTLASDLEARGL